MGSYSNATQIGLADQAKNISGNTGSVVEEGGFLISGSNITDNSKSNTAIRAGGVDVGANAAVGDINITTSDQETIDALTEWTKLANAAAEEANASQRSFYSDFVKKIGEAFSAKSDAALDPVIDPTIGEVEDKEVSGGAILIGLAVAGAALWFLFIRQES